MAEMNQWQNFIPFLIPDKQDISVLDQLTLGHTNNEIRNDDKLGFDIRWLKYD